MRSEHLWAWTRAATREESPDPFQWDMVVGLVQAAFCEVHLA